MPAPSYEALVSLLTARFHVQAELIRPEAALGSLGLDSLTLMDFVFAMEDECGIRIPEERLDPRRTDLTLADICAALDEARAAMDRDSPED